MAECILESAGGGSVQQIAQTTDGAFKYGDWTLKYPGMAGCTSDSSRYITFPSLLGESGIEQDNVYVYGEETDGDPEYTIFHSSGKLENQKPTITTRTNMLLYSKNAKPSGYPSGFTGYVKEPEFYFRRYGSQDWRTPKSGIYGLNGQYPAFPAVQMNDRIIFSIPFLASWSMEDIDSLLYPKSFVRLVFSKIGSTYFTFYRRNTNSTTKLNAVNMNVEANYSVQQASYGIRVEYRLPNPTDVWTAGIVSMNNLSNAVKLLFMPPETERGEGICRGTGWEYVAYNNSPIELATRQTDRASMNFRATGTSTSQYVWCYSPNPVDLTGISYIFVPHRHWYRMKINSASSGSPGAYFGVCSAIPTASTKYSSGFKKYVAFPNSMPENGLLLDVSSLSGEHYLAVCLWANPNDSYSSSGTTYYRASFSLTSMFMV